jgi:phospholipid transport system substrate-binding protein
MRRFAALLLFLSMGFIPERVFAGTATAQISATINQVIAIMIDTPVAELIAKGLPDPALKLIHDRFDFSEMTKRALGSHWQSLAPADQTEFVDGLTHRLLLTYGPMVRAAGAEKILFKKETVDGDYASVESLVITGKSDRSIDYRLHEVAGQWRVYDMTIEHVSIVSNFHAQFAREIARSSVQGLLEKIKQRAS